MLELLQLCFWGCSTKCDSSALPKQRERTFFKKVPGAVAFQMTVFEFAFQA
ncbi:hypothetical protein [Agrobacterium sp. NPDC090283]|uniref:hypothetical protein n=1 Tax=Agrobacterium sp. NPDC090283 TaxID=3363920 RepID=UPI00383BC68C